MPVSSCPRRKTANACLLDGACTFDTRNGCRPKKQTGRKRSYRKKRSTRKSINLTRARSPERLVREFVNNSTRKRISLGRAKYPSTKQVNSAIKRQNKISMRKLSPLRVQCPKNRPKNCDKESKNTPACVHDRVCQQGMKKGSTFRGRSRSLKAIQTGTSFDCFGLYQRKKAGQPLSMEEKLFLNKDQRCRGMFEQDEDPFPSYSRTKRAYY